MDITRLPMLSIIWRKQCKYIAELSEKKKKEKAYFNPVISAVIFQVKVIKSNPDGGVLRSGDDSGHVHIARMVVRVVVRMSLCPW